MENIIDHHTHNHVTIHWATSNLSECYYPPFFDGYFDSLDLAALRHVKTVSKQQKLLTLFRHSCDLLWTDCPLTVSLVVLY